MTIIYDFFCLHKRWFTLLLFLVLSVQLVNIARKAGFSPRLLRVAFVPGSGELVSVPPRARAAFSLLKRHGQTSFRLTATLERDVEFRQRLTEFSYPVRLLKKSPTLIAIDGEPVGANCSSLAQAGGITLHRCDVSDAHN